MHFSLLYVTDVQLSTTAHQGRRRMKLRTRPQTIRCNNAGGVNLVDFLRSMLLFKPCDRSSAGELFGLSLSLGTTIYYAVHTVVYQLLHIEGASGDAILWCHGNLYFYFPPLYFSSTFHC